ncbi:Hydrogenase-4 component B [Candidatus Nitrosocosmicus oleophilus]|uniref:Hydrogenase-4 component B n=1 Tax=Candidatus Nitrosocosmicus oleophilus TaxID=1353260 RepID=A0A654M2Z6_9ARCH|nr:proton-conducting transporter membrane subunit [Candidatus Nitrosocosmicus oleophilus]ALI37835.1 Hydrogenase-4 component B [Candidatus Nitrosocosmicus oleophilus]
MISVFENSISLFWMMIISYIFGAIFSLLFRKYGSGKPFFIPTIIGSIFLIALSLSVIFGGSSLHFEIPSNNVFSVHEFLIDGIAAFFLLLIGLVSFSVSIYSLSYIKEYIENKHVTIFGFFFNTFILSMILLVSSNDVFSFIVFWELMSITSFFLVIYNHENESNLKSGIIYLVMTNLGTALILASLLLLSSQTGSLSFESFRLSSDSFSASMKNIVFILAFVGFGTKAGIVPLHIWLPYAHPSAPSNVSALMSAIMIKTAVYGLIRIIYDFSGVGSGVTDNSEFVWWGLLFVTIGAITSVVGVLYSVVEKDIKRALAYSSIENIGIIFIGIGLSLVFLSFNLIYLSAFAMLAAMLHLLNHAIFKSLLFMGVGAIIFRTHTANMEKLGGLVKRMPWTSLLFLVGVLSISGLPFFNGFVSEYLVMLSFISTYHIPDVIIAISFGFASAAFALTLGIVLATFVKIFGISFLSKPRTEIIYKIKEVPHTMLVGMGIVAVVCVILGLIPSIGISMINLAFNFQVPLNQTLFSFGSISSDPGNNNNVSELSLPVILVIFVSILVATIGFLYGVGGRTKQRISETWSCGVDSLNERMQYTASSLSQPILHVFRNFYRPTLIIQSIPYHSSNPYIKKSVKIQISNKNIIEDFIYEPIIRNVIKAYEGIKKFKTGKVNLYLLNVFVIVILLLLYVRLSP